MKLSQLLSVFPQLRYGDAANLEVLEITQDSRHVRPGTVFVAIRGSSSDGHKFLSAAAQAKAVALVVEDDRAVPPDFRGAVVKVANARSALDLLAQRFYGNPAKALFCVGVTGTNGKTTVTYMVEAILRRFGWSTGVFGTIDHHLEGHRWPSSLTTPDALTLHRRLKEFVSLGAQAAAFEVSSHALDQSRADGLPFSVAIFTNLTRDHLDYHETMENYFAAKEKLFLHLLAPSTGSGSGSKSRGAVAVLNGDDEWVRKVRVGEGVMIWWYGTKDADFTFRVLREDLNGSLFHLSTPRGNAEVHLPCPGLHNIYNATASIAAALAAGVSLTTATEALAGFYGAPGRLEKVPNNRGLFLFVDYAHTDDALRSVLRSLSRVCKVAHPQARIVTVFGCGGDRDRGKRPLMAEAACEHSDVVLVTSDNPRGEPPKQIIDEIVTGIPSEWKGQLLVEMDRRAALARALQTAREGDVILVAGKGHEDYQIVGDQRLPFSDQLVLRELLL